MEVTVATNVLINVYKEWYFDDEQKLRTNKSCYWAVLWKFRDALRILNSVLYNCIYFQVMTNGLA